MQYLKIATLLILTGLLRAQTSIQTQLFKTDLPFYGSMNAVAVDPSGYIFAVGTVALNTFVVKMTPDFHPVFVTTIPADITQSNAIALDSSGNIFITGQTVSDRTPAVVDMLRPNIIGCETGCSANAYVVKVDGATGNAVYATYFGGRGADSGTAVAVAADGSIYVAGTTDSPDFPTTEGALMRSLLPAQSPLLGSEPIGFVVRISADGTKLISSTYFNGSSKALALDSSGGVYLTGQTSEQGPGTAGAYQTTTRAVSLMASSTGGSVWNDLSVPARVLWVEPDPSKPGLVYAGTISGLLKSSDGGASWSDLGDPFASVIVTQVRVDPTTSTTIYAIAVTDSVQSTLGPIPIQAIWKTEDGGEKWTKLKALDSFAGILRINQSNPSTLYLTSFSSSSIMISRDNGRTWLEVPIPSKNGLTVDAADGDVVYIGRGSGYALYHSVDAGQHWELLPDPAGFVVRFNVGSAPIFASGSTILYNSPIFPVLAGGKPFVNGMRRSQDGGQTWSSVMSVPATAGFADLHNPKNIYITGPAGPFFSPDLGDTWVPFRAAMDNPNVTQIAVAATGSLYAAAAPQPSAFVAQLNSSLSHLSYYTCYGGSGGVSPSAIAIDSQGRAVIGGSTTSRDMPVTGQQTTLAGFEDGFVARFSADGSRLDFARFFGGSNADYIYGLALSPEDRIYLAGVTTSADFPVTTNAWQSRTNATNTSGFAAILGSDGALQYSTIIGGSYWDGFKSIALKGSKVYLGGYIGSVDFPGASATTIYGPPAAALVQLDFSLISLP